MCDLFVEHIWLSLLGPELTEKGTNIGKLAAGNYILMLLGGLLQELWVRALLSSVVRLPTICVFSLSGHECTGCLFSTLLHVGITWEAPDALFWTAEPRPRCWSQLSRRLHPTALAHSQVRPSRLSYTLSVCGTSTALWCQDMVDSTGQGHPSLDFPEF